MQSTLIQGPQRKICISGPLQTEVLGMEVRSLGHYYKLGRGPGSGTHDPSDRPFLLSFLPHSCQLQVGILADLGRTQWISSVNC